MIKRLWLALAVAGATWASLKLTRSKAEPVLRPRLVEHLDEAIETPALPNPHPLFSLASLPQTGGDSAVAIPFTVEPDRGFVVRVRMSALPGKMPEAILRRVSLEELHAFGSSPRSIDEPGPGVQMGLLHPEDVHLKGTALLQRFDHLPPEAAGALLVIKNAIPRLTQVEVYEAEMGDARAPLNPIAHRLVRRFPNFTSTGTSWRSGLVARPQGRYVFDVTLPKDAVLTLATGHESGEWGAPVRFLVLQDGRQLLDEVVPFDHYWHDHQLPLEGKAGTRTRLSLVAEAVPGASGEPRGLWANPRITTPSSAPSILLVTVDALRPDHLSAYGYGKDTSPSLSILAKAGVRFERASAQAARTWESLSSLLTGRYPVHSGVRERGEMISPEVPLLADILAQQGYRTFAGTDVAYFPPQYLSSFDEAELSRGKGKVSPQAQFRRLATQTRSSPVFAWFHLENPHYPLLPKEPMRFDPDYRGRFQEGFTEQDHKIFVRAEELTVREQEHINALYDAEVFDADKEIRQLLGTLNDLDLWENTIVVVTADHGERLGEHGVVLEHVVPYDSVLHVPLIWVWPEHIRSGLTIRSRVQLVDLMPTLLSLVGLPRIEGLDGRDLSMALNGQPLPDAPAYGELVGKVFVQYRDNEKLFFNPSGEDLWLKNKVYASFKRVELFDLSSDPGELSDLAARDPNRAQDALAALQRQIEQWGQPVSSESGRIGQAAFDALVQAGYLQVRDRAPDQGKSIRAK